jgi:hypothetical protein
MPKSIQVIVIAQSMPVANLAIVLSRKLSVCSMEVAASATSFKFTVEIAIATPMPAVKAVRYQEKVRMAQYIHPQFFKVILLCWRIVATKMKVPIVK